MKSLIVTCCLGLTWLGIVGVLTAQDTQSAKQQATQDQQAAGTTQEPDEATKARQALEQMLSDKIKDLDVAVRSDNEEERIAGFRKVIPNEEVLIKLFGETDGKKLWSGMEPALKRMLTQTNIPHEATLKMGGLLELKLRNCREEDAEIEGYKDVLKIIPAEIPIYNAAIKFEGGMVMAGSYAVVDDRMIWLRGLEQYAKILKSGK